MKRLIAAATLGLVLVGCGGNGPSALGPGPSGSPVASPSITPSPSPSPVASPSPGKPFTFQIWLTRDGKLFATKRTEPFVPGVAQLALNDLLEGPTSEEIAASVGTAIPANTSVDIPGLVGGVALVQVSASVTSKDRLALAQLVYTLTQYSTISSVEFTTRRGLPYTRASFADLLPPIVVESPVVGQTVQSPVTISGTANVFEAVVSIKILDENGKILANTFTNASCGTGCRGDYSWSLGYTVTHQQSGIVEVYEVSVKDGSAINVQDIPVILMP